MPLLFVYGTLQDETVQQRVFGRAPEVRADVLAGYRRREVPVSDPVVAARIGIPWSFDLCPDPGGRVDGTVLDVREEELVAVDGYERADGYLRIAVTLASGASAWAYMHARTAAGRAVRVTDDLRGLVEQAMARLQAIPDVDTARPPVPGKWCPREILGHLVDSAVVNHERFLRARWQDDLVFEGYDQDAWVEAHGYAEARWPDLLQLWRALNRHLAQVMDTTPEPVRARVHTRHTLDRIAFGPVRPGDPVTLELLMQDYVAHLRHHLRQVLGDEWERTARPA